MKILVVEDSPVSDELVVMLRQEDYEVDYRDNLADARYDLFGTDNIPTKEYDALILDLMMPMVDLPKELRDKTKPAGWIFYEKLVKEYDESLYKNTIFHTGYEGKLREVSGEAFDKINVAGKNSKRPIIDEMKELLQKIESRK